MTELKLPPINALICMHNNQVANPIQQYLAKSGARKVSIADSQTQVRYALKHNHYDFYMIEQNLPGIKGIELYEYLKITDQVDDDTVAMLCMTDPSASDIKKAKELGVKSIIAPPFTIKKIQEQMLRMYGQKHTHFPSKPPLSPYKEQIAAAMRAERISRPIN